MRWCLNGYPHSIGQSVTQYAPDYQMIDMVTVERAAKNTICQHGHVIQRGALYVRHFTYNPATQKCYCMAHQTDAITIKE